MAPFATYDVTEEGAAHVFHGRKPDERISCFGRPPSLFKDGQSQSASLFPGGMPIGDALTMGGAMAIFVALSALARKRPKETK